MAAVACTTAGLAEAGKCFKSPLFSSHDQKAILAYLWWKLAESAVPSSATDFATLVSLATCIPDNFSDERLVAGMIAVLNRGVSELTGIEFTAEVVPLTSATAAEAIKCIVKYDDHTLDGTIVYNMCKIFSALT